jgi:hypothetical protein
LVIGFPPICWHTRCRVFSKSASLTSDVDHSPRRHPRVFFLFCFIGTSLNAGAGWSLQKAALLLEEYAVWCGKLSFRQGGTWSAAARYSESLCSPHLLITRGQCKMISKPLSPLSRIVERSLYKTSRLSRSPLSGFLQHWLLIVSHQISTSS